MAGHGGRAATLHHNPNRGGDPATFLPQISTEMSCTEVGAGASAKDVRSACEEAWSLKSMPDIDVRKTVRDSKGEKPAPLTIQVSADEHVCVCVCVYVNVCVYMLLCVSVCVCE